MIMQKSDPLWEQCVMDGFQSTELVDGNPTICGLRRMVELMIGKIISCQTTILNFGESYATAIVNVTVETQTDIDGVLTTRTISQSGSADVSIKNTVEPYIFHPVSMAETRAEARAFRKLLNLSKISEEEAAQTPKQKIVAMSERDIRAIKNFVAKKESAKYDVDMFLIKHIGMRLSELEKSYSVISKDKSGELLELLNNNEYMESFIKTT